MKKILFLSMAIFLFANLGAQKKITELAKTKIGTINGLYQKTIDFDKNDTSYISMLRFQNSKYSSITDNVYIAFLHEKNKNSFIEDLKAAIPQMGTKTTMLWDRNDYSLNVYDFSKNLYVREAKRRGSGYTEISKSQVEKLIEWLSSFEIGKN